MSDLFGIFQPWEVGAKGPPGSMQIPSPCGSGSSSSSPDIQGCHAGFSSPSSPQASALRFFRESTPNDSGAGKLAESELHAARGACCSLSLSGLGPRQTPTGGRYPRTDAVAGPRVPLPSAAWRLLSITSWDPGALLTSGSTFPQPRPQPLRGSGC